jgi:hypothetical protein
MFLSFTQRSSEIVHRIAEALAEKIVFHEVVGEVVEYPMPKRNECSDPRNPTSVIAATESPPHASEEKIKNVAAVHETAEGQEEVSEQFVVQELWRSNLCDQPRRSGC